MLDSNLVFLGSGAFLLGLRSRSSGLGYCKNLPPMASNPLEVEGVAINGRVSELAKEFIMAKDTNFNTVLKGSGTEVVASWVEGTDVLEEILSVLPSDLNVVFGMFPPAKRIDWSDWPQDKEFLFDWFRYVLDPRFTARYKSLTMMPVGGVYPELTEIKFEILQELQPLCRSQTDLPLGVAFAGTRFGSEPCTPPEVVERFEPFADFIIVDFYHENDDVIKELNHVLDYYLGFGKPVIIWGNGAKVNIVDEMQMRCYLLKMMNVCRERSIHGFFIHNLRESSSPGGLPWGIYNWDWTPKLAVDLFI